jgi:ankyrin repeat protein
MLATLRGHTDIVRLLLDHGSDPNMKVIWQDPFIFYEGWVLGFLSPGERKAVFINEARTTREATPLIVAAGLGHIDIVRALLSAGADVNAKDEKGLRALTWALMNGHTDILVLLSKHGAKE